MQEKSFKRRAFLKAAGATTIGFALSNRLRASSRGDQQELLLYVGTYTKGESEGIYLYRLNLASGELHHAATTGGVVNPSYLVIEPRRRFLYAVNEVTEFAGKPSGAVSAFSINRKTGALRFINQQPSLGGAPCYLSVDEGSRFVLVANYVGGNVAVLPIQRDGSLGRATDASQYQGSGLNPERQEGPHAHCILLDRANRYAYACDLGTDKIMIHRFDSKRGKLKANIVPWVQVKPGAGPRHLAFHPGGRYVYVLNELSWTITAFIYDGKQGTLRETQTVATLPEDFAGTNTSADIHLSPSGKFLYASNRGHDSIAVFAVDEATGKLVFVERVPTGGKTPRNFAIDPTGKFLLAANQDSNTVVTFHLDAATGRLTPTGHVAKVPSPVCLKLIPAFSRSA